MSLVLALLALGPAARPQEAPRDPAAGHLLDEREVRLVKRLSPLPAVPPDETNAVAEDPRAADLGQRLFFDPALSREGDRSCASCHLPERAFTDGLPVARGRAPIARNTPTLLDSAHARWFFWDGRADSAWAQALQPIENPAEMGGDRRALAATLRGEPDLAAAYRALFGPLPPDVDEPSDAHAADLEELLVNVGKSLAAYQRRLVSGPAPFDRFVRGLETGAAEDLAALDPAAQRGLKLFLGRAGCRSCHFGPRFTDDEFHALGLPPGKHSDPLDAGRYLGAERLAADRFNALGPHSDDREGARARATQSLRRTPASWGAFRTPSLRNVARTAPYMHAGQFESLEAVVHFYSTLEGAVSTGHHGESVLSPLELSEEEQADLVRFLESLSGSPPPPALLAPLPATGVPGEGQGARR